MGKSGGNYSVLLTYRELGRLTLLGFDRYKLSPSVAPSPRLVVKHQDAKKRPFAVFEFRYRTMGSCPRNSYTYLTFNLDYND